ncbi:hypothetical protein C8Q79DRAFT_1045071 [Trametes meyenii]|nr:hypothetical protein C8Q79DRAFT_1045071 [Trametes meyenii]
MADIATPAFLDSLKALYPADGPSTKAYPGALANPWVIVAAVAFSASNAPEAVPVVFEHALAELRADQQARGVAGDAAVQEQLNLARKVRESVFQSGLLSGMPRTINSLFTLSEVMPEALRETKTLRDTNKHMSECDRRGEELFRAMYRDTADTVQGLLDAAYPDLGWFCNTVGYGLTYGGASVLTQVESTYAIVAALVAVDAPRQVGWHLANARHGGADPREARAVRAIAVEVARRAGVVWKHGVPDVES